MIIASLTIALVLLGVSLFANWRMYSKIDFYEQWYEAFARQVGTTRQELDRMDRLGAFEADDEIGYFFDALKDMMNQLYQMGFYEEPPDRPQITKPKKDRFSDPSYNPLENPGYAETPPVEGLDSELEKAGGAEEA
jgi:hypothetical protein